MNCYLLPNNKTHGFGRLKREFAATEKHFILKHAVHSSKGSAFACLFALVTTLMESIRKVFSELPKLFGKQYAIIFLILSLSTMVQEKCVF